MLNRLDHREPLLADASMILVGTDDSLIQFRELFPEDG